MVKKGEKRPPRSEEWSKNISLGKMGSIPWNKGKTGLQVGWNKGIPMRPESKISLSNSLKGRPCPDKGKPRWPNGLHKEITDKISAKLKGKKQSKEHVKKRIESRMKNIDYEKLRKQAMINGKNNKGKTHKRSEEYCKLQSIVQKAYWESEEGRKRKDEMSHARSNVPRSPRMQEILRSNRLHQIFPKKDSIPERMMQLSLSLHGIKFGKHRQDLVGYPDIFIEPNTCVFVDGDYWHANPEKYTSEVKITKDKLAKDVWARDSYINHKLNKLGYQVIRIWESDIKKDANECAENIIKLIQQLRGKITL